MEIVFGDGQARRRARRLTVCSTLWLCSSREPAASHEVAGGVDPTECVLSLHSMTQANRSTIGIQQCAHLLLENVLLRFGVCRLCLAVCQLHWRDAIPPKPFVVSL